jgi:hypothetical protein
MIPRLKESQDILIPCHPIIEADAYVEDSQRIELLSIDLDEERKLAMVIERLKKQERRENLKDSLIGIGASAFGILSFLCLYKVYLELLM